MPEPATANHLATNEVGALPVCAIRPLADQPRSYFDPAKLDALGDSIAELGQLTAIQVVRLSTGESHAYELIEGERRLRVFRERGWAMIRAEVKVVASRTEHWVQSFVANMGREGYTPMEAARGVERMSMGQPYNSMTASKRAEAIGRACGRSQTWVYHQLLLLKLDPVVQKLLEPGVDRQLASSIATVIARDVTDPAQQRRIAKHLVESGLTGARARIYIRQACGTPMGPGQGSGRQRSPSDDIAIVENAAQRLEVSLDVIGSIPKSTFDRFAKKAGTKKIRALERRLRRAQQGIDVVADALEKVEVDHD